MQLRDRIPSDKGKRIWSLFPEIVIMHGIQVRTGLDLSLTGAPSIRHLNDPNVNFDLGDIRCLTLSALPRLYAASTVTFFVRASSATGAFKVSKPFLNSALTFSGLIFLGR